MNSSQNIKTNDERSESKNENSISVDSNNISQKDPEEFNGFCDVIKNKKPMYVYTFKTVEGKKVENPTNEEINNKHSDGELLSFITDIKNQRHITKPNSKGKNLEYVQDDIATILVNSREAFSDPKSLEQLQEILNDSLKIYEARGIVVNKLHNYFQDYSNTNIEKLKELGVNAVSLSSKVSVDKKSSPNAEVICHSSLYETSPNSFNHAIEVANAKKVSVAHDTKVFVTGDVPLNDPEVQKFIGNRRLIITESKQNNFDYYFWVTELNGEEVVVRGDLKNRPIERIDNLGELKNFDAHTFIYVGKPENDNMRLGKINQYCNAQQQLLNEELALIKSNADSYNSSELKSKIALIQLKLEQIELYRLTNDIKHLDSFDGAKPLFHDFVERRNGINTNNQVLVDEPKKDWYDPELALITVRELD